MAEVLAKNRIRLPGNLSAAGAKITLESPASVDGP